MCGCMVSAGGCVVMVDGCGVIVRVSGCGVMVMVIGCGPAPSTPGIMLWWLVVRTCCTKAALTRVVACWNTPSFTPITPPRYANTLPRHHDSPGAKHCNQSRGRCGRAWACQYRIQSSISSASSSSTRCISLCVAAICWTSITSRTCGGVNGDPEYVVVTHGAARVSSL